MKRKGIDIWIGPPAEHATNPRTRKKRAARRLKAFRKALRRGQDSHRFFDRKFAIEAGLAALEANHGLHMTFDEHGMPVLAVWAPVKWAT
jgi:hypothetical protein